jgi:putative transposase
MSFAPKGIQLRRGQSRTRPERKPWPDWLVWTPNRIWIWDATHFTRCGRVCFAIVDLVSRKWIGTHI